MFTRVLLLAIALPLLIGLYRGIYNRYFHPLRKFPGPFWASVSDFFKLWILSTKQAHTLVLKYHEKYGPVVRAAPNLLAVNDPYMLPRIYHRKANKTDVYTTGILGEIAPPFQTIDWREHAAKRKRIAFSFQLSNLKPLEGQIDARVLAWIGVMDERFAKTGKQLDWAAWAQYFAYDMVCSLSFGEPIGFIQAGKDVENLIQNFRDMAPFAAVVGALPWLVKPFLQNPLLQRWFMPKPGDSSGTGKIMAFRDRLLKERLDNPKAHHQGDFLDNLLASKNADGTPMSIEEIKTECFVLMVAASDTTASLFSGFVRFVIESPGVLDKLMKEIQDFDAAGKLSQPVALYDEIQQMPYFVACFREAIRFHPSTPMIIPRYVSEPGMEIGGLFAPGGAEIGANPFVIHRDKRVFGEDAYDFNPERWLESEERTLEMEKYILTWGYGARVCIGKNIAMMESYKSLLEFFRNFRPSIPNKGAGVWNEQNLTLLVHTDFWINIKSLK